MSGSKNTPGPWIAVANRGNNAVSDVVDRDGYTIAHCRNVSVGCWEANARLIAAAPDTAAERDRLKEVNAELLSALKHLLAFVEAHTEAGEVIPPYTVEHVRARAAIAKAERGAE